MKRTWEGKVSVLSPCAVDEKAGCSKAESKTEPPEEEKGSDEHKDDESAHTNLNNQTLLSDRAFVDRDRFKHLSLSDLFEEEHGLRQRRQPEVYFPKLSYAPSLPVYQRSVLDSGQKASLNSEAPFRVGYVDTQMLMPAYTSNITYPPKLTERKLITRPVLSPPGDLVPIWQNTKNRKSLAKRRPKDVHKLSEQIEGSGHHSKISPSPSSCYKEKEKEALHSSQSPLSYLEGKTDLPSTSSLSFKGVSGAYLFRPPIVATSFCIPPPTTTPSSPSQEASKQSFSTKPQSSIKPTVAGPPCPENSPVSIVDSTVSTTKATFMDASRYSWSDSETQSGYNIPGEMVPLTTTGHSSATDPLPAFCHLRISDSLRNPLWNSMPDLHMSSMSQIPLTKNKIHTQVMRSQSLPDMLRDSFERFSPDVTADENGETYRFQCTSPGLYQCRVTGLVFNMEGKGDVTYRIVHWNQMLLTEYRKKPAGPLFDIKCEQQSVCQLHLPHCEIWSTGGCKFLSVAHVTDDGTDFIPPHKITETHVVINITGFSGFGVVRDEDSPPDPIRAVVLLFYRPPIDPDRKSFLHVLLLPDNIVLSDVLHKRKKRNENERYIEGSPDCIIHPKETYMLSTSRKDRSIRIQPKKAKFYRERYQNYFTTFEVILKQTMENIKLLLKNRTSSHCVWKRRVYLSSAALITPLAQSGLILPPSEMIRSIRSSFIERISGPVLKSLLDKLFEKRVINDSERERADEMQNKTDKASFVIDTVRKKGKRASSEMIALVCEMDPFLSESLGLM